MLEYAQDAMETDKPWEKWEFFNSVDEEWLGLDSHPGWGPNSEYRRKTRTININGHEVPEPVREPLESGTMYYMPELSSNDSDLSVRLTWKCDDIDELWLKRGVIHLTKEAATAHAKALLSFTTKEI